MSADPDLTAPEADRPPDRGGRAPAASPVDDGPGNEALPAGTTHDAVRPDSLSVLREALTTGLNARILPGLPAGLVRRALVGVVLAVALLAGGAVWLVVGRSQAPPSTVDVYGPAAEAETSGSAVGTSTRAVGSRGSAGATAGGPADGDTATTAAAVHVHAAGAVVGPGLYRLRSGARVADLIAAAGGLAPDADADRVNLAAPVVDGSRVYVPRRGESSVPSVPGDAGQATGGGAAAASGGTAAKGPVNVNSATVEQLDTLPGIGPTTAQAIVDHRTKNGPFRSVEDLAKVRGIGPAKLADLRPLVTV